MTLLEAFEQIEDHRSGPAKRYDLKGMIITYVPHLTTQKLLQTLR